MSAPGDRRSAAPLVAAMAAVVAAAYAATLFAIDDPLDIAIGVLVQLVFVAPGVAAVARLQPEGQRWLAAVTFGPAVGLAASSLTLLALWAAGGRGAWVVAAAPAVAWPLAAWAPRLSGRWRLPVARRGDLAALLAVLLLVPLLVGRPFAMVGVETERGVAYKQYFTADYVWRRAVVAELAKGDVLPKNPYYRDDALHYYWLPHLLSAVEHRVRPGVDLDALLLTRTVLVDAFFLAALYGLARAAVAVPWAAAAGVASGLLVTSAEGLVGLWHFRRDGLPLEWIRYLNVDAVARWYFDGMPIDGLQRVLWYQPHHAAGYVLGLLGVVAVAWRTRPRDPAVFTVAGALLACSTLLSSFAGLMFTAIAAVVEAAQVLTRRRWYSAVVNAAYAALPLALGAALVMALHYVDQPPDDDLSVVQYGLNAVSTHRFWLVTAMSVGPALLVGLPGLVVAVRHRLAALLPFATMLPVAWWFYFFIDIRDHQNVYVGWRVGHLTFLALVPFNAVTFVWVARQEGGIRRLAQAVIAVAMLLGVPTTVIDAFNTQDIRLHVPDPGLNHAEFITAAEADGLAWLRERTAADAVVQVDTEVRGDAMWAYIPAFAERRMAAGLPLSMVPLRKYIVGAHRIHWLYHVDSAASAYTLATRYGIDYLVVGAPERQANPGVERRWAAAPSLFVPVFHNDALDIFAVQHPHGLAGRPAARHGA